MRGPSRLLAARTACITKQGRRGLAPHVRAAPPQPGWGTGGGGLGVESGGTTHRRAPQPSTLESQCKGFLGPRPGSLGPHPGFWGPHPGDVGFPGSGTVCGARAREAWAGGQRPVAAMTHGAWGGRYDSCNAMMHASGGRGGKAWTPTAYGGSPCQPGVRPSAAAIAHLGGVGNLRKEVRGSGGAAGVWCARSGGAVGWWEGVRVGGWGCGELSRERHRVADRGRGAAGAGQSRPGSPGRSWCWGPRSAVGPAPRSAGTNPAEHHPRGRPLVEAGKVPHRPLAAEPDRDGPAGWITGGRAGLGTGTLGPGSLAVVGRREGDLAGPLAVAGEGGRGRAGRARGRTPRGPQGQGEGSRGRPFLGRGGRGGSLPGERRGPLLSEGGELACIARCRAMCNHGRAAWDYIPNPPRRSPFVGGS